MSPATPAGRTPPEAQPEAARDGRRRRGQDNRARIVAAMLELIQAEEVAPSAEQVAARADVGLRTVFRHFRDMDSLYGEMSGAIEAELRKVASTPFEAADWRGRVMELVERRGWAFDRIGPYMRASAGYRHKRTLLDPESGQLARALRAILVAQLPPEIVADKVKLEALDLLLSFEAWSRLRRDQGLSSRDARQVLEGAVGRLLG